MCTPEILPHVQGILETHYIQLNRPLFSFLEKKWNDRRAVFQKQNMLDNEGQRMEGRRWPEKETEGRQRKGEAVFRSGGNTM